MTTFNRIVVPVDFSEESKSALVMAGELASTAGGDVILLHVLETPSDFVEDLDLTPPTRMTEGQQLGRVTQALDDAARKALPTSIRWSTRIEIGKPALKIVEAAEQERADLVVMGTTGRTGLSHLLIGSVAERVVRLATCPVMTMRRSTELTGS